MAVVPTIEETAAAGDGKRTKALAEKAPPIPPESASATDSAEVRRTVEKQIDDFLRSIGMADPASATDENGWRHMQLGSASGRAGVIEIEGELFLRAEAPVMPLPSDADLVVPLMRELLELNCGMPVSGRLGICGESVWAEVMVKLSNVRPDTAAWCIHNVMTLADHVDDSLQEKYGGTSITRTPDKTAVTAAKRVDHGAAARKAADTRKRNIAAAAAKADEAADS